MVRYAALVLVVASFALGGCKPESMKALGKWNGAFVPSGVLTGTASEQELKDATLRGYVQLYGAGDKFELRMEGKHQAYTVTGTWSQPEKDRLELRVKELRMDKFSDEEDQGRLKPYIEPDDLRKGYGRELILKLDPRQETLTGLKISLPPYVGRHEFKKISTRYTY